MAALAAFIAYFARRLHARVSELVLRHHFAPVCLAGALCVAACGGDEGEDWQVVFDDLDATAFGVWGSSATDVWIVGADAGEGPLVLHYDGERFARLDSGARGDLWWVFGRGDSVWMSGEGGLVLRYSRASQTFESFAPVGSETLFGTFPLADDDVWAVGGNVQDNVGVAYRFDGAEWREVTDLPAEAYEATLFKVWGRSADDLWMVGFGSVALHRDAEGWSAVSVPTGRRLLTVHGNDTSTVAVGGFASGLVVEASGSELVDRTPEGALQVNGVWVPPAGDALAAGNAGTLWRRRGMQWHEVEGAPSTRLDYHAAFIDERGGRWAVGGRLASEPYNRGIVAHRGEALDATFAGAP